MTSTVTITHHQTKPEYQWEIVVPEAATIMVTEDRFAAALDALGMASDEEIRGQLEALPNGGSRSVNVELGKAQLTELEKLGVKKVMQG